MTTTELATNSIRDRVFAICNDLYSKGTKPSVRMVLSMLPGVSSTSTVHNYFKEWKKELEANTKSLYDKLGFSSEFTQAFMKEITRFGLEAEARYKEQAQDAHEDLDVAVEALERAEERAHKQESVVTQQNKEIQELHQEITMVRRNLEAELATERKAHQATVSELRQQLDDQTEQNTSLLHQNESLRTEIAKAQLRLEGNENYVSEVKEQQKQLQRSNQELSNALSELRSLNAAQNEKISGADKLIQKLEDTISRLDAEKKQAESQSKDLSSKQQVLVSQKEELSKQLSEATAKLEQALDNTGRLTARIEEQSAVIDLLSTKGKDK